ncbi:tetratricopeptide repeat protein [Serratia fonticola]|nr:tetratricopeptide repeat protein [Serratia fonticola]NYA39951.1 tetratricopeptide repeat protein [Serratia fonticola]
MDYLDDLPKRDRNHVYDTQAKIAFEAFIQSSRTVIRQWSDENDYGTDYQLEVVSDGMATNVRLQVQLKGTTASLNADGSVSISVKRANLNYLLMHPGSFYVCFHIPSQSLKLCSAQNVFDKYQKKSSDWQLQETITVNFIDTLTDERLLKLASLTRLSALTARNRRISHMDLAEGDDIDYARKLRPTIEVSEDADIASKQLFDLYSRRQTEVISASYDRFRIALGENHPAMMFSYFAEIDLANANKPFERSRVEAGIIKMKSALISKMQDPAKMHYSIGNGHVALDEFSEALVEYQTALELAKPKNDAELISMIYKNMGGSYTALENECLAVDCYHQALSYNPHLAEAHFALGLYYHHTGQYEQALEHLDKTVFSSDTQGQVIDLLGWRISTLFNLGESRSAFREITSLLGHTDKARWIWPWCMKMVASFGRKSTTDAKLSLSFWERYLCQNPDSSDGKRELLLAKLYLHNRDIDIGDTYTQFRTKLISHIKEVEPDEAAALLWDGLGHWAEDENEDDDAVQFFRKAYDIQKGDYGLCLANSLNNQRKYEETIKVMLEYTKKCPEDPEGWYLLAASYDLLGQLEECIDPYQRCLLLNPAHELAWFNLGGVYFNSGNLQEARRIWKQAVRKFPAHELTQKLYTDIPFILMNDPN